MAVTPIVFCVSWDQVKTLYTVLTNIIFYVPVTITDCYQLPMTNTPQIVCLLVFLFDLKIEYTLREIRSDTISLKRKIKH